MFKIGDRLLNFLFIISILLLLLPFGFDIYNNIKKEELSGSFGDTDVSKVIIYDQARLLSKEETDELYKVMEPITAFYPVAFVSTMNTFGTTTAGYAIETFRSMFKNGEGILFLIDMNNRYLYLYTSNSNMKLSVSKCDSITDNVYRYASGGDYYTCAAKTFEQVYQVMSGISIPQPMKHMSNALIALCISLFAVFCVAIKKTQMKKPEEVYQLDKNMKKSIVMDNVIKKVTRTYSYSNSSSSSGGHHSSGHHSGGHGGGHGF